MKVVCRNGVAGQAVVEQVVSHRKENAGDEGADHGRRREPVDSVKARHVVRGK